MMANSRVAGWAPILYRLEATQVVPIVLAYNLPLLLGAKFSTTDALTSMTGLKEGSREYSTPATRTNSKPPVGTKQVGWITVTFGASGIAFTVTVIFTRVVPTHCGDGPSAAQYSWMPATAVEGTIPVVAVPSVSWV